MVRGSPRLGADVLGAQLRQQLRRGVAGHVGDLPVGPLDLNAASRVGGVAGGQGKGGKSHQDWSGHLNLISVLVRQYGNIKNYISQYLCVLFAISV